MFMKHLGIEISVKNQPVLDPAFIPMGLFNEAFLKTAKKPVSIQPIQGRALLRKSTTNLGQGSSVSEMYVFRIFPTNWKHIHCG
jgi:hypothetical protein